MAEKSELKDRCDAIEECYEFTLAYAAQGFSGEAANEWIAQLREFLTRCDRALSGLADLFTEIVSAENLRPFARYEAFIARLDRDARDAQATLRVVLAQPSISSQLVDNLNASIHLRALLADLFLLDEIVRPPEPTSAASSE